MNNDILKGQWRQVEGSIRESFGKLTDDDMEQINGNMEMLVGRVQERYGYTREEAHQELDKFWNKASGAGKEVADKVKRAF